MALRSAKMKCPLSLSLENKYISWVSFYHSNVLDNTVIRKCKHLVEKCVWQEWTCPWME
jgi:hypothetical protein